MSKMKLLDLKILIFFDIVKEINKYRNNYKCLARVIRREVNAIIADSLLDKIEHLKKELPEFTEAERRIVLKEYKHTIKKNGICICGGNIDYFPLEWTCDKCGFLYYEE